MPKLLAAAIQFYPKDSELKDQYDKMTHVQGFLTNTNQFVDRYEAMNMALDWGQVSADDGYESGQ